MQCFMIKTPLKKVDPSLNTVVVYMILIVLSYLIVLFYLSSDSHIPLALVICTNLVFFMKFALFCTAWLRDPGYLKKDPTIDFYSIIEKFDPNHLCPECEVIRTERSRHCNICNRCVERFDHHCPWINNCVGIKNHGIFYAYILMTIAYIMLVIAISSMVIYYTFVDDHMFDGKVSYYDVTIINYLINL